jgi:MFS family permease
MGLPLSRDGWLLMVTCGVRSFAYGFLSVVLGLYLDAIGFTPTAIGWIFTAALTGGAVMTIVITAIADRFGRKMLLVLGAVLMAMAGCVFAVTDNLFFLTVAAIFGTISPSGKEVGPFLSIEQAILPQTTQDQHRTAVFSAYNLVGSLFGALGALAVGLPLLFSLPQITGYRLLVWSYAICAVVMIVLFGLLSASIEANNKTMSQTGKIGVERSRGIVAKLAGLFALDAFAGGFIVQSIVAYWFYLRYKTDLNALGGIFFRDKPLCCAFFSRRSRDSPAFRTPKYDGLYSSAIKHFAPVGPFDAKFGTGRHCAPHPEPTLTARCADSPVLYDGSRRSR